MTPIYIWAAAAQAYYYLESRLSCSPDHLLGNMMHLRKNTQHRVAREHYRKCPSFDRGNWTASRECTHYWYVPESVDQIYETHCRDDYAILE